MAIRCLDVVSDKLFLDIDGLIFMEAWIKVVFYNEFGLFLILFTAGWFWFSFLIHDLLTIKIDGLRSYIYTISAQFILIFIFNWTLHIPNWDKLIWIIILLFISLLLILYFMLIEWYYLFIFFNLIIKWFNIIFEFFFLKTNFKIIVVGFLRIFLAWMWILKLYANVIVVLKARWKLIYIFLFLLDDLIIIFFIPISFKHWIINFLNNIWFWRTRNINFFHHWTHFVWLIFKVFIMDLFGWFVFHSINICLFSWSSFSAEIYWVSQSNMTLLSSFINWTK